MSDEFFGDPNPYVKQSTIEELQQLYFYLRQNWMKIMDLGRYSCLVYSALFGKPLWIPRDIQSSVLPAVETWYLYWHPHNPHILTTGANPSGEEVGLLEDKAQEILKRLKEEVDEIKGLLAAKEAAKETVPA